MNPIHRDDTSLTPGRFGSRKLLYFITEDWFFCSHFLDRASAARQAGYDVCVVTRVDAHAGRIERAGIRVIPLDLNRSGLNLFEELRSLLQLFRIYRAEQPAIVHHIAAKPILYGTLVAKCLGISAIVNAPVGLGYVFASPRFKARLIRPLLLGAYRWLMNPRGSLVVFENPDDLALMARRRVVAEGRARLIRGAGVDTSTFIPCAEPDGPVIVVLPARMLWDKGIAEFVEAARMLAEAGTTARFALLGSPDERNPSSVPRGQLDAWARDGVVEYWGFQEDMPDVLARIHIVCLPSYREGLPKALVEAAAAGRPIVATDVPGCREICRSGVNGILVPPKSPGPLADALRQLIRDPDLRNTMGQAGREMVVKEFSSSRVTGETLSLYRDLYPISDSNQGTP